jgi:membrane protein required for colicin V production
MVMTESVSLILALGMAGAALLLGALINHFMARMISLAGLELTDRLLGSLFGVARGVLIVAVAVYFAAEFYSDRTWWVESRTLPYIQVAIDWGSDFFAGGEFVDPPAEA